MRTRLDAPPEELRDLLTYRDGSLFWKHEHVGKGNRKPVDVPLGTLSSGGYLTIKIKSDGVKRSYLVHRLIYWLNTGKWPEFLDHRDRNKLNNNIENLREVTAIENQANRHAPVTNTTGYVGVWPSPDRGYIAGITFQSKRYAISGYDTAEKAALARDMLLKLLNVNCAYYNILDVPGLKVEGKLMI